MSIESKIEDLATSKSIIRSKMVEAGQATRNDKLATLANNLVISSGTDTSDATATASDILNGKTAYAKGEKVTGSMTNNGAVSPSSLNAGSSYTIPAGYHNGSGKVTTNSLASQTSATATAEDIAKGKTAWVNGIRIIGTGTIILPPTIKSFSEATDAEITEMLTNLRDGKISYYDLVSEGWVYGAERPVHLSAMAATGVSESHVEQDQTLVILHGKDFFEMADGTKNLFVIGIKDLLGNSNKVESGYINSSSANTGGWNSCARRTWCNSVFKNALPTEVQKWFKQFKVKASNGSKSTSVTESTDWFTLPSRAEVFGGSNTSYTPDAEGTTVLDYYNNSYNRIKSAPGRSAGIWWLRSPYVGSTAHFCDVNGDGTLDYYGAVNTYGLSPFGCV